MTGLIILAAGESKRLGKPKQNLVFRGKTLLQIAVEAGIKSACKPVIVVLGANGDQINKDFQSEKIKVVHNPDWGEGMASSIRSGISELKNDKDVDSASIMLCDQPFVNASLLDDLAAKQGETGKPIVACAYNNTVGVPVLFGRSLFGELLLLQGHQGAKNILKNHEDVIVSIPFKMGGIDVDTLEDYERLNDLSN